MKYAFVSDLHANIQAWKMVYHDIQANNVDRIISLGDVVGYGPNPREILKEVRAKVDAFVLGNHDAVVAGKLDESLFNDDAQKVLNWTKKQLTDEDRNFLGTFPLTLAGDGFRCVHGEFTAPANFDYVLDAESALPSWKAVEDVLLFVGHTHEPALYILGASGTPRSVEPQDFVVDPGKRYLVNIGSVGQPRGSDVRSCYCIYDSETKSLYWRRVSFDVDAYRKSLKATGLQLDSSYYLQPAAKNAPAQKLKVFLPPKSDDKAAHDVVAVQDIKILPRRPQKMPLNMKIILAVVVLMIGTAIWRTLPHTRELEGGGSSPIASASINRLAFPARIIEPGTPIPGWTIHLEDKYRQAAGLNLNPFKQSFLYLRSKREKHAIRMVSSRINTEPGQTWSLDAAAQKYNNFSGRFTVSLVFAPAKGSAPKILFKQDVGDMLISGLSKMQGQITLPASRGAIQACLEGNFSGTILFPQLSLKPTDNGTPLPEPASQPAPDTPPPEATPAPDTPPPEATPAPAAVTPAPNPVAPGNDPWAMPPKK
jgi:predicted phosphodiesterase